MRESIVKRILARLDPTSDPEFARLNLGGSKCWSQKYPDVPSPDSRLSPQVLAAAWTCHDIYGEEMPRIAADLLEAGVDSPSLRQLAGEIHVTCSADVERLVAKAFRELDISYPLLDCQAQLLITRQIAREVIAGERGADTACTDLFVIWGRHAQVHDVSTLLTLSDEMIWDSEGQRFVVKETDQMLDIYARLGRLTDEQILAQDSTL